MKNAVILPFLTAALILTVLFTACIKNEIQDPGLKEVVLSTLGNEGEMSSKQTAYDILDLTSFGYWSVFVKSDLIVSRLGKSAYYSITIDGRVYTLEKNPLNPAILQIILPETLTREKLKKAVIKKTIKAPGKRMKRDSRITIEKVIIKKKEDPNNGTDLYGIKLNDYISMYADDNNFIFNRDDLIRPAYVTSNEENAYSVHRYIDAREVSETKDVNGAFQFLKDLDDYESHISFINPNRVNIEGGVVKYHEPDERWRFRQLGKMGSLDEGDGENTYNIINNSEDSQIIALFKRDTLPATYTDTYYWKTELKEATVCKFNESATEGIYKATISYTDIDNTEIVKNSRFEAEYYTQPDVELKTPENDEMIVTPDITLTWAATPGDKSEETSLRASSEIIEYRVEFATKTENYPDPATTTEKEMKKTGLQYCEEYKWQVTALQDNGKTSTTASRTFQMAGQVTVYASDGSFFGVYKELSEAASEAPDKSEIIIYEDMTLNGPIIIEDKELSIKPNTPDIPATVSGNGNSRGFEITNNASVSLDGIVINNCKTTTGDPGAGIYLKESTLIVSSCRIESNIADGGNGGGIYAESAMLTIKKSKIASNTTSLSGGGLRVNNTSLIIRNSVIKDNYSSMGAGGIGIKYSSGPVLIKDSVIASNTTDSHGGGIYIAHSIATLHSNKIKNNTAGTNNGMYCGGILIDESTIYNADSKRWRQFKSPAVDTDFIEHNETEANNNTYSGNSANVSEGSNIYFQINEQNKPAETPQGTLILRPESEDENQQIIMNVDFTTPTPISNASVTLTVSDAFEITDNSSVTIGDGASNTADQYSKTATSITIKDITATKSTTVTLRLTEQDMPPGMNPRGLTIRDIEYNFKAKADADGTGTAWSLSPETTSSFKSIEVPKSTNIVIKENRGDLRIIESPATIVQFAKGLKVKSLSDGLEGADGSEQTYVVETNGGRLEDNNVIPGEATLTVISEYGEEYTADYTLSPLYIRLATGTDNITWHETLQDAVDSISTGPSTITVCTATLNETKEVEIDGKGTVKILPQNAEDFVTLDGNRSQIGFRIGGGSKVSIERFEIVNCFEEHSETNGIDYGAIILSSADLNLNHCILTGNQGENGAAIMAKTSSFLKIKDSTITQNRSTSTGGAIYGDSSEIEIITTTIVSNTSDAKGGGLMSSACDVVIKDSIIASNTVETGLGGGIYSEGEGTLFIDSTTIASNTAKQNGGGVYTKTDMILEINHSTITANTQNYDSDLSYGGGGLYTALTVSTLTNTAFTHNVAKAGKGGGGIYLERSTSTIFSNDFIGNELTRSGILGGGLFVDQNSTVFNSDNGEWNRSDSPEALITNVENTEENNNEYINNQIDGNQEANGADIAFGS